MEIKEILEKPYSSEQEMDFYIRNTQVLDYEIRETEEELQAWGLDAEEEAEKEQERIAQLQLTRGDVFRALLLAKGVTRTMLRSIIEAMPVETPEQIIAKEMALIDFDEALDYYRGVALIDTVGAQLGISAEQMTNFFKTNDYHELTKEPEPEPTEEENLTPAEEQDSEAVEQGEENSPSDINQEGGENESITDISSD